MKARLFLIAATGLIATVAAACSTTTEGPAISSSSPEITPTVIEEPSSQVATTAIPEETSVSPLPTPASTPSDASSNTESSAIPTIAADTPLGLEGAFQTSGKWEENRYNIADLSDLPGMGVAVDTCTDNSRAPELEYRLANKFETLSFEVGQDNASASSDQQLAVRILGNESQIDIQKVPFNQLKSITVSVRGVNALKVRLFLDDESVCDYASEVNAIIHDFRVE